MEPTGENLPRLQRINEEGSTSTNQPNAQMVQTITNAFESLKPALMESVKSTAKEVAKEVLSQQRSSMDQLKNNLNRKRKHDSMTFEKKGHKDQYEHNLNVLEKIEASIDAMEENDVNLAKETLCEVLYHLLTLVIFLKRAIFTVFLRF